MDNGNTSNVCLGELKEVSVSLSKKEFYKGYLSSNKPCLFGVQTTDSWKSRKEWVKDEQVNWSFLSQNFGEASVPVVDCSKRHFSCHEKTTMKLRHFIDYVKRFENKDTDEKLLYVKDWHLQRSYPDYEAYSVPMYFQSDWLNEFWDQYKHLEDDYRFVYIGVKGSWTPFHADVYRSFSWSANVCGRKKWFLYPPGEEDLLKDKFGHLVYDVTDVESSRFPSAKKAKYFVAYQETGQVLFVPSGWFHQVHNLEHTISINHNWTNAYGLQCMWNHLSAELKLVKKEIFDCFDMEGWHDRCQLIMKANAGIDYALFYDFITSILSPRLDTAKLYLSGLASEDDLENVILQLRMLAISDVPGKSAEHSLHLIDHSNVHEEIRFILFDLESLCKIGSDFINDTDSKEVLSDCQTDKLKAALEQTAITAEKLKASLCLLP